MPIVPVTQAQPVTPSGGFDYVTVDAQRRRVYAAHGGGGGLLIADADTGKVLGIVKVGPMAWRCGRSRRPDTSSRATARRAPSAKSIPTRRRSCVRSAVDGPVDAIAYDPRSRSYLRRRRRRHAHLRHRYENVQADRNGRAAGSQARIPSGRSRNARRLPEYLRATTPSVSQIVVIDPTSLTVARSIPTPALKSNHPLQYDAEDRALFVAGENNVLAVYDRSGKLLHQVTYPGRVDQCSLGPAREAGLRAPAAASPSTRTTALPIRSCSGPCRSRKACTPPPSIRAPARSGSVWNDARDRRRRRFRDLRTSPETPSGRRRRRRNDVAAERGARHHGVGGVVLARRGLVDRPVKRVEQSRHRDCSRASDPERSPSRCRTDWAEARHSLGSTASGFGARRRGLSLRSHPAALSS